MPDASHDQVTRRESIQRTLAPRIISEPLQSKVAADLAALQQAKDAGQVAPSLRSFEVILELNLNNPAGRTEIRADLFRLLTTMLGPDSPKLARNRPDASHHYFFATLDASQIQQIVAADTQGVVARQTRPANPSASSQAAHADAAISAQNVSQDRLPTAHRFSRAIFRIWESQPVRPLTTESIRTVKANAAHSSFGALGEGIVWAIMDSGIDETHPHFKTHSNLTLAAPLTGRSTSFVPGNTVWNQDVFGHGTHVAGIVAGEVAAKSKPAAALQCADNEAQSFRLETLPAIKGMAPRCGLLILRVLDDNGDGDETALIQAIEYVQQLNDFGRHIVVHGVNISAGFDAHPTWYACGQTPLCVEINRLVRSGVVVVVAAGNSGHVTTILDINTMNTTEAGQTLSINDPGNADLAITVGSTHRQAPHTYGVSYFSSKGPTSDGRKKPEVVAPGEKIISCASAQRPANATLLGPGSPPFQYIEDTGTSMAAPHVSGIVAAFLSVKREYLGQPEQVKELLTRSAIDLNRDPNFQGAGLVDLMKLLQSV